MRVYGRSGLPRRNLTCKVTIDPGVADKLDSLGGRRFGANVGVLFELMDELGFFETIERMRADGDFEELSAAREVEVHRRARAQWLAVLRGMLQRQMEDTP